METIKVINDDDSIRVRDIFLKLNSSKFRWSDNFNGFYKCAISGKNKKGKNEMVPLEGNSYLQDKNNGDKPRVVV